MDRNQLKIQAYKEKVSEYEERIADLRVELTVVTDERDQLRQRVQELEAVVQENQDNAADREFASDAD